MPPHRYACSRNVGHQSVGVRTFTDAEHYAHARPFPHLVVQNQWPDALLDAILDEWPDVGDPRWHRYANDHERKLEGGPLCWGPATTRLIGLLGSAPFVAMLSELTGIAELTIGTEGGGMHCIEHGGYLAPHIDFSHGDGGLWRRVNVLVFLCRGVDHEFGGSLELWGDDGPQVIIPPSFNTSVVFSCSDRSFHGHPRPWTAPFPRRSIAAYFFSPEPPPDGGTAHSTVWRDCA